MKKSQKPIPFAPPKMESSDIRAAIQVLKSGWITTGPKVKELEKELVAYTRTTGGAVCVNSATAGLETVLRALDIGPGDEVITCAYTYTSSASTIHHAGAKIVLADVIRDGFHLDPADLARRITSKTKAIVPVDYAGIPCDYDAILRVLDSKSSLYSPKPDTLQTHFRRPVLLTDAAHSIGAKYRGLSMGAFSDFTAFSFHAVKNVTCGEGGAILWKEIPGVPNQAIHERLFLHSMHGQNKDALAKLKGSWRYDILLLGKKYNMPDIQAAIALSQLKRYAQTLKKRKKLYERYLKNLKKTERVLRPSFDSSSMESAYHLFPIRIDGFSEAQRDAFMDFMKSKQIATNVHFVPLPMHTAYKNLGFRIGDYPNSFDSYRNMVTLPLHLHLSFEDIDRVCEAVSEGVRLASKTA